MLEIENVSESDIVDMPDILEEAVERIENEHVQEVIDSNWIKTWNQGGNWEQTWRQS